VVSSILTTYIYGLVDPRTGEVRYIGKSDNPRYRLTHHCRNRLYTVKGKWIKELIELGTKPDLCIFECVDFDKWEEREKWWIRFYLDNGVDLLNSNLGGSGGSYPDTETRKLVAERVSKTMRGRPLSESHKKALSIARKGIPPTEKVRQANIKAMTGRKLSEESIRKRTLARIGKPLTEEHKKKIGDANRGRVFGEDFKSRMERQSSKLTIEQIREIRQFLKDGIPNIRLAERFDVHPNTIYYIKSGKIHKRVI
jgi:hypothetical protein